MSTPFITVGQLLGHYRLIERIGGGGQGEVFRAHDERFDKDVALKILPLKVLADEEARKRFRQEALAVGRLSHPNVATAFYFGEENGVDFLVTEYVAGSGLDEKLAQGPMPEQDVVTLGIQLASGLEAAHHEGIIHRDLKPGNLRITQNGSLKILDFGLAELVDSTIDVASAETVTINMTLTGTLPYMAPEQFGGVSDQRTDLWSAGAVLYEMATGQLPFVETNLNQLRMAILHNHPVRPTAINPKISQGLERLILRCLQKDPGKCAAAASPSLFWRLLWQVPLWLCITSGHRSKLCSANHRRNPPPSFECWLYYRSKLRARARPTMRLFGAWPKP
jgi:serine/threonine protein kinase